MSAKPESLNFFPLGEEHIPALWRWLQEPHVAEYWQEPDCKNPRQLKEKFLGKLPLRGVYPFVLYADGSPIGYFQYYDAQRVGGGWWPEAKFGTYGIDQFIGEPKFIERGVGSRAIRKFVQQIFSQTPALEVITDPDPTNGRAIQVYRKCGFTPVGEITTPGGKALLMRFARSPLSDSPIRAILTDLDGVIRFFPARRDSEIEERHGLAPKIISRIAFRPELLDQAITGKISDEIWRERILGSLQDLEPNRDARSAVAEWSSYPGEINLETLSLLRELSPGPLALLTNATSRLARDLKSLKVLSYFDLILNSSELGVAKPASEIFQIACERLSLSASQVLFLDDSEKNVAAARSVGLVAMHFSTIEKLKDDLKKIAEER